MKKILTPLLVLLIPLAFAACDDNDSKSVVDPEKAAHFDYILEQSSDMIAVYGSKTISKAQYDRVVTDIRHVLSTLDSQIKNGLFASHAKLLVVKDEAEVEGDISYYTKLLPLEAIFADNGGTDETLPSSTDVGLSNTKLEMMYLCVYYSLLTDPGLSSIYEELKAAYKEASDNGIFTPGDAYKDGYVDEIHQNASDQNALKYGSYLYNLYKIYFGNQSGAPGEFTITTKAQLKAQNVKGHDFIRNYFE